MDNDHLVKIYKDNKLNDITGKLIEVQNSQSSGLLGKIKDTVFGSDETKIKKAIQEKIDANLRGDAKIHSCLVNGDLSNEIDENVLDQASGCNNILFGLDEKLNPIYLNNLNLHMSIYGQAGSGKTTFLFQQLKDAIKVGRGVTYVGSGMVSPQQYQKFITSCDLRKDDVILLDFNAENKEAAVSFDLFEAYGTFDAIKIIKELMNHESSYWKNHCDDFLNNCSLLVEYIRIKGGKTDLYTFLKSTNLKAHLIQAIPPQDSSLALEDQVPDSELVCLNQLSDFEEFWIPPTYSHKVSNAIRIESRVVLKTIDPYGFYIEVDKLNTEYNPSSSDKPQVSEGLHTAAEVMDLALVPLVAFSKKYKHLLKNSAENLDFRDVFSQGKVVFIRAPELTQPKDFNIFISLLSSSIYIAGHAVMAPDLGRGYPSNSRKPKVSHILAFDVMSGMSLEDSTVKTLEILLVQARTIELMVITTSHDEKHLVKELSDNIRTKVVLPGFA